MFTNDQNRLTDYPTKLRAGKLIEALRQAHRDGNKALELRLTAQLKAVGFMVFYKADGSPVVI